jgi:hypothetical protein
MLNLFDNGHIVLAGTTSNVEDAPNIFDKNLLGILSEDDQNIEDDFKYTEKPDIIETLYDAKFTLKHQFGYKYQDPQKAVANRSSLRLEITRRFRTNYLLFFDGKVTYHYANDHLTKTSEYSSDVYITEQLREIYLQASFNSLSFKFGKQIIKWGESEISVVDEMSPKNLEEMYFADTEDERIGQYMMECAYFRSGEEYYFFVNPDLKVSQLPAVTTEYYTELPEDNPGYRVREKLPQGLEYGLRLKHYLSSGDLSLIMANLNDNDALYKFNSIQDNIIYMDKIFERYQLFAIVGNLNLGNVLLKGELACKLNKEYLKTVLSPNDSIVERSSVDVAMDIEYLTTDNTTLRFGLSNSHIIDWDDTFDIDKNEASFFLGWSKSFLNETLESNYLLTYEDATGDIVHKLETEYFFKNDISLKLNLYYFEPGDGYTFLKNGGRITADISWHF